MTFGAFDSRPQPMSSLSDINITPMVDVMLVLLVIFILTAPMFTQAIKLDLPRATGGAAQPQATAVALAIDGQGNLFWNDEALAPGALDERLAQAAGMSPQPELQLRADKETRYEVVAQVMAAAQAQGLTRLGFVTEPGLSPLNEKK
jgi:biopolymer transport protein ExbD